MFSEFDRVCMARALAEAERGLGWVEPNPMVGAVVARDGQIISVGHHKQFGGPHAEVNAIDRAGESASGATVYVSLEPCCHHGKTPPCADLLIQHGVKRVVAAMRDPFPKVDGGGTRRLREAGIQVDLGLLSDRAQRLNAPYLKRLANSTPYVIAKWAMTLDGKTATASGDSRWISSARSRSLVHELRGRVDAIVAGIGTVLADNPRLDARPRGPRIARRVILDSRARLPLDGQLAQSAREIPVLLAVSDQAPPEKLRALEQQGVETLRFSNVASIPVALLLQELGKRGATNILVEGGGRVTGAFLDANEVDEVDVYVAPLIEGGEQGVGPARGRGVDLMSQALRLQEVRTSFIDGDVRIQGMIPRPWRNTFQLDDPQESPLS